MPFRKKLNNIETIQRIWIANQLAEAYTIQLFTEGRFRTDYNFIHTYSLMQWWGVEIRGDDRSGKIIFIYEG